MIQTLVRNRRSLLNKISKNFLKVLAGLSLAVLLMGPVDVLEISAQGEKTGPLFRAVCPIGTPLVTRYIHSVQKTPVEDEYLLLAGQIIQWEERFVSHNAGLPVDVLPNARFFTTPEWMVIRGGRTALDQLVYRVGTEALGRNVLLFPGWRKWPLYRMYPGRRLIFRVVERPLLLGIAGTKFPH